MCFRRSTSSTPRFRSGRGLPPTASSNVSGLAIRQRGYSSDSTLPVGTERTDSTSPLVNKRQEQLLAYDCKKYDIMNRSDPYHLGISKRKLVMMHDGKKYTVSA